MATLKNKQLQDIVDDYIQAGRIWPTTTRDVAAWAILNDRWKPQPSALVTQCADQISRAMREEYRTDPQGRRVRAKHPAPVYQNGKQMVLWDDISTASPGHMRAAFQTRRRQIVGDCHQLKTDLDSYNDNHNNGQPIQMVFDFAQDLQELDAAMP